MYIYWKSNWFSHDNQISFLIVLDRTKIVNVVPSSWRMILAAFLADSARQRRMNKRRRAKRETICRFNVASDLCRSLHVPSDSSSAFVLCSAVGDAYQNRRSSRGASGERRGKSRGVHRGGYWSLISAAVCFIRRGPSRRRLKSRRPPFIRFLSSLRRDCAITLSNELSIANFEISLS